MSTKSEFVEEAMKLCDEAAASAAREGYMPGGYMAACGMLRAHLEQREKAFAEQQEKAQKMAAALRLLRDCGSGLNGRDAKAIAIAALAEWEGK